MITIKFIDETELKSPEIEIYNDDVLMGVVKAVLVEKRKYKKEILFNIVSQKTDADLFTGSNVALKFEKE